MDRIVLFERDADLRKLFRMLLRADYALIEASDPDDALKTLREIEAPLVVVLGDWPPGASGEHILRVAEHDAELRRHAYILVTTRHDDLAPAFRDLLSQLSVPVVPVPGDLDVLKRTVRNAQARLTSQRQVRRT